MKIVIVGAGVAGSVLANLLGKRGYNVTVIEKDKRPGGMCKSYYKRGFVYEYGPHILAMHNGSRDAEDYLKTNIDTIDTELSTASVINGILTYYPPSIYSAEVLGIGTKVKEELQRRPRIPNESNFETYLIDQVGDTLYKLFFCSFTKKFWGVEPSKLSSEWAKVRHLGEKITSKKMFFNEKWCGYPKKDWNVLFENLLRNINVIYDIEVAKINFNKSKVLMSNGDCFDFDLLISTMHIDQLFDFRFGELGYTGYSIEPRILDRKQFIEMDGAPVSMTYYPDQNVEYTRVTDYGTFQHKCGYPYDRKTIVTYEYPDKKMRLYPFSDDNNIELFYQYLQDASMIHNVIIFGRMGLYKYLTCDTTVDMALRLIDYVDAWHGMTAESRYDAYKRIRGGWDN